MLKLEVKLKQHTPLIHFQHDQDGAALRSSEVKPRLDKYLKTATRNNKPIWTKEEYSKYLIGAGTERETAAFDYKLRISASGNPRHFIIASYLKSTEAAEANAKRPDATIMSGAPYFAQEKEYKDRKWNELSKEGILYPEGMTLTFTCRNQEMLDRIASIICLFFAKYNFGTRQSKGFGCFSVSGITASYPIDEAYKKVPCNSNEYEALLKESFSFIYKYDERFPKDSQKLFSAINTWYKTLKSGDSAKKKNSALMLYFDRKGITWEKNFIKKEFFHDNKTKVQDAKFVRALLGLTDAYDFKNHGTKVNVEHKAADKNNKIERYGSPVTVKVHDGSFYFAGNEIEEGIKGQKFNFTAKGKTYPLATPSEFSLRSFMQSAMSQKTFKNKDGKSKFLQIK